MGEAIHPIMHRNEKLRRVQPCEDSAKRIVTWDTVLERQELQEPTLFRLRKRSTSTQPSAPQSVAVNAMNIISKRS